MQMLMTFGPVEIAYDESVLRPRPWTLVQAEWAAEVAADLPPGPILELCAGAGQIGLAAAVLTGRSLVQVEQDRAAARFAADNAQRAGVGHRCEVRVAACAGAVAADERFPLVLADPPYIPAAETGAYAGDPLDAIDGGADGLVVARDCLRVATAHLVPGGSLLLQLRDLAQASVLAGEAAALRAELAGCRVPAGGAIARFVATPVGGAAEPSRPRHGRQPLPTGSA